MIECLSCLHHPFSVNLYQWVKTKLDLWLQPRYNVKLPLNYIAVAFSHNKNTITISNFELLIELFKNKISLNLPLTLVDPIIPKCPWNWFCTESTSIFITSSITSFSLIFTVFYLDNFLWTDIYVVMDIVLTFFFIGRKSPIHVIFFSIIFGHSTLVSL